MLQFSTERPWAFQQEGTGSNSHLRLRNTLGFNKQFSIDTDDKTAFRTHDGSSTAVTIDHSTGTIAVGAITFPDGSVQSTAKGIYTVGVGDFIAREHTASVEVFTGFTEGNGGTFIATSNDSTDLVAPVHLPQGATMTKVTFYGYDAIATTDIKISIHRRYMNSAVYNNLASHTSNTSSGAYSAVEQSILDATIDNSQYNYYIVVELVGGTWHSQGLLAVKAVVIEYTL